MNEDMAVGARASSELRAGEDRRGLSRGQRVAGFALVVAAVVAAGSLLAPSSVRVNGVRVPIGRGWTGADCACFMELSTRTGDLVDVNGAVLVAGGGRQAGALNGGVPVALSASVRRGDRLTITPAADVREPIIEIATHVDGRSRFPDGRCVPESASHPFIRGIKRERRGGYSDKIQSVEIAYASAVVHAPDSPTRPKCVAFTFDDGPNDTWTPKFLAALSTRGARGTFFVLGQAVKPREDVFRKTLAQGHEVGVHSWRHNDFRKLSNAAARADLTRCLDVMKECGAETVRWFRPPWGEHPKRIDDVAAELGLRIAMWDIDTLDWQRPGVDKICERVMKGLEDGAIVLMHDGPKLRAQTLAAVERLIPAIQSRGYILTTLSEARGLVPVFAGEVVLNIGGKEYRFEPLPGDLRVEVNGERVEMPVVPLRLGAEILVPARAVGGAVGCRVQYDPSAQTVLIEGGGGGALFRLDSTSCELDGKDTTLSVPPILYGPHALVPLSVLKRIALVSCVYDGVRHVLLIQALQSAWMDVSRGTLAVAPLE